MGRLLVVVAAALVSAAATAGVASALAWAGVEPAPVSWSPDVPAPVVVQVGGAGLAPDPQPCAGGSLVVVPVGG